MTKVKLWQIVSQTPNTIVFSDANGNLTTLAAGTQDQVLVINAQGVPEWAANNALSTALQAKTDATNAIATANAYTQAQIAALVDNAPIALNTLNELAIKLNGEDSAINALLLQVDGKAEKTEVDTLVAQAKQDTLADARTYTDTTVATAVSGIPGQITQAKSDAISSAATDATQKSDAAKAAAIASANDFTTQSVAQAVSTAAADTTNKVGDGLVVAAQVATQYTDSAIATLAQSSAADATQKAADAKTAAVGEAKDYVDHLPSRLFAKTTATACFVASSNVIDPQNGETGLGVFAEVTSVFLGPDTVLTPKLLFVNGLAMSSNWTAESGNVNNVKIHFEQPLMPHVFDGTDNAIMVLCEYTTKSEIYAVPPPVYMPPAPAEPQFPNP